MNELQTLLVLKYQLPTEENFSLDNQSKCEELLNTYPKEVVSNWAWRCAEDVEHLAKGNKEAEACIAYAKSLKHKMGDLTHEERKKLNELLIAATYAARAAYYAACVRATAAAYHAATTAYTTARQGKWNEYRLWLIEELCKYEEGE